MSPRVSRVAEDPLRCEALDWATLQGLHGAEGRIHLFGMSGTEPPKPSHNQISNHLLRMWIKVRSPSTVTCAILGLGGAEVWFAAWVWTCHEAFATHRGVTSTLCGFHKDLQPFWAQTVVSSPFRPGRGHSVAEHAQVRHRRPTSPDSERTPTRFDLRDIRDTTVLPGSMAEACVNMKLMRFHGNGEVNNLDVNICQRVFFFSSHQHHINPLGIMLLLFIFWPPKR